MVDSLAPERVVPLLTGRFGRTYRYAESTASAQQMFGPDDAEGTEAELPTDAQTEPTSLRLELDRPVDRAELLAAILARLEIAYDLWVRETAGSG